MIPTPTVLLTAEQVEQIHQASLEILAQVGVKVHNAKARKLFAAHGCSVESESNGVKFPPSMVEDLIQAIPPTVTLHGRDPQYDRTLPDDGPLFSTGSSAPNVIDRETGRERRSLSVDIAQIAYLINELPGYDVFTIATTADDAPAGQFTLSRVYPALRHCLKPIIVSAPDLDEAPALVRFGGLVAGSEAAYRQRPFITFASSPLISPLTLDDEGTETYIWLVEQQMPCFPVSAPIAGLTAPVSLLGALAVCNAEFLTMGVLTQAVRRGAPLIYAVTPAVVDMRTGAFASGAIESGMFMMGCAQMARYYHVPSAGWIGQTNAKVNDAQSGFETGMLSLAAMLAGTDLLATGGLLDALMAFDFGKAVTDNEIAQMLKRLKRGYAPGASELALDVIAAVGPGGAYIDTDHTWERMKTTLLIPEVADRDNRHAWQEKGALDAHTRTMQQAQTILEDAHPPVFSPELDEQIRKTFPGIVAGQLSE